MKTLVGDLPALGGDYLYGHQIETGYFDQQLAQFSSGRPYWKNCGMIIRFDRTQIRTVLGRFLFTSDDVFKTVDVLSGGEKVRLSLAKLMLRQANFLVLDEPTNHLDIVGKEALEEALNGYTGTILFVSHDRYFISKIATAILHLDMQGNAVYYPFGYEQFDEDQQQKEKEQAPKKDVEVQRQTPKRNPNAREAAKLENKLQRRKNSWKVCVKNALIPNIIMIIRR
ncbi:MAG: ATP-binding cassette domain-containing protein [Holdemania massiliensis]